MCLHWCPIAVIVTVEPGPGWALRRDERSVALAGSNALEDCARRTLTLPTNALVELIEQPERRSEMIAELDAEFVPFQEGAAIAEAVGQ